MGVWGAGVGPQYNYDRMVSQVKAPSKKCMFVESYPSGTSEGWLDWRSFIRSGDGTNTGWQDRVMAFRHRNAGGVVFVDGHVELRKNGDGFWDRVPPGPTTARQYWDATY